MVQDAVIDGPKPGMVGINHVAIEVVIYANVQFTKAPPALHEMGLDLAKTAKAQRELAEKGMM